MTVDKSVQVAIVGGGISGLATAFELSSQGIEVALFEAESLGGKIGTSLIDGYLCEHGPHAVLGNAPDTVALFQKLGLTPLAASDQARSRYVFVRGRLEPLPSSLEEVRRTKLLGPLGKARLLFEPMVCKSRLPEETVDGFFRRRCGRQVSQRLAAPLCAGIYAGDPRLLSVQAAFPKLTKLFAQHGSLVRALRALASAGANPAAGATLLSLPGGMVELVNALVQNLGASIVGRAVTSVERTPAGQFRVGIDGKPSLEVPVVVLATPVSSMKRLLGNLAAGLGQVPTVAVDVCALGFRRQDVPVPLDGYGFLVAAKEDLPILGCLYESSLFPGRAPPEHVLLRVMLGGGVRPDMADATNDEVLAAARSGLRQSLGIVADPVMTHLHRYRDAIPQYTIGHLERVAAADRLEMAWPGLFLAGNHLRGVGVNDCIREAKRTALRVAQMLGNSAADAEPAAPL